MADTNLGTAVLRTGLDASGLRTGLQQAGQQISGFAQRGERDLARLGQSFTRTGQRLSIGLTAPIVALGALSLRAASDAEETGSKFATVFRDIGDDAERAADRLGASFGLSSTNARRLLGDTGDLLTGFGFTQDAALDLAVGVNELAVDLASFTNFSGGAEGASAALTKALLGETESLKSLGVAIRQTDVEAKVLELTQQGLTFETDRQARAYATLALAQEQSVNAIGDYARTSDSFANTVRGLGQDLNELQVVIGERLLPTATRIVGALREGVRAFTDLNPVVQTAVLVVGGLAAAAGPLLLVLGQIVTIIPKVTAGLAALRTAGLLAAGPAGWIALGVIGVGGLALSLSGRGDSLDAAVEDASEALAGRNAGELVGALDRVIAQTDGPVAESLQGLRDELVSTGDIGVEQTARIAEGLGQLSEAAIQAQRDLQQAQLVAERDVLAAQVQQIESLLASERDVGAAVARRAEIEREFTPVLDAGGTIPFEVTRELQQLDLIIGGAGISAAELARQEARLADARQRLADLNERLAPAAPGSTTPPPGSTTPPPAARPISTGIVPRTAADAVNEAGARGAALNRQAALGQITTLEALEGRFSALQSAITEIITDFPDAISDYVDGLLDRQAAITDQIGQIDAARAPLLRAEAFDARLRAEQEAIDARLLDLAAERAVAARREAAERAEAIGQAPLLRAEALDEVLRAERDEIDALIAQANSERVRAANRAARDAARAAAQAPLLAAQDLDDRLRTEAAEIDALIAELTEARLRAANRNRLALRLRFDELASGTGPGFAGAAPGVGPNAAAAVATAAAGQQQAVALATDTLLSLQASGAPASELLTALERLRSVAPDAARRFDSLAISLVDAATVGGTVPTGLPAGSIGPTLELPEGQQRELLEGAAAARLALATGADEASVAQRQAGQDFALSVAQAGAQFTLSLVDSIRNGDVGGAFQSILSGAGSITGALASFGPAAGLISGAAAGPLGIAAAILPIVGSLIGGLFGGRRQTDTQAQQAEEAQRRQRSTPSIQISASVSQVNNYGSSNVDPRVRADNDARTREIIGEVLRQVGFADIRRAALGSPT